MTSSDMERMRQLTRTNSILDVHVRHTLVRFAGYVWPDSPFDSNAFDIDTFPIWTNDVDDEAWEARNFPKLRKFLRQVAR